ncbi:MAG TPA: TetR/AcrR family transcriptional regulator [Croceibacterium sp.]|jgi:AcrR family transcriptional regulator|nr:TetR/AcrR family transcriptional regulator [Croceibacterium sp.]
MSDTLAGRPARDLKKQQAREQILDAFIELMTEGAVDLSHDAVAERTGLGRRTVYRYFPDRAALMDGALLRVRELAGVRVDYPRSADDLLETLEPIYTGFDAIAPIITMLRTTPQGRQLRLAQNDQRVRSYSAALADAVRDLTPSDRRLATAMLQVLHTTPWLEMRDHWGLSGRQIARATGWAVRTLLRDLQRRGSLPLDRDLPAPAND